MIEVHLLRYMLAAADTGSFSRAADRFGVKQSTLSRHVLNFELRTGLSLFERSTRGVVPTDLGERFLSRAARILHDIDALGAESRELAAGTRGSLRLGFHGSLRTGDLSAILRAYAAACPDVQVRASERDRSHLIRAVERDQLDLAICAGESPGAGLASMCCWREPVVAGIAPDHPLASQARVYWTDLRRETFVVTAADPGPDLASLILSRLSSAGHQPAIGRQDVGRDNLLSFASAHRVTVSAGVPQPGLGVQATSVPIHDAFGPTMLGQGVHWRRDNRNPALGRFLALLAERYGRILP